MIGFINVQEYGMQSKPALAANSSRICFLLDEEAWKAAPGASAQSDLIDR